MQNEVACFYPGFPEEGTLKALIACFDAVSIIIPPGDAPPIPDARAAWGEEQARVFEDSVRELGIEGQPWTQAALPFSGYEHLAAPLVEQGLLHLLQPRVEPKVVAAMPRIAARVQGDVFTQQAMRGIAAMSLETVLLRDVPGLPNVIPVPTTDLPGVARTLGGLCGVAGKPTSGDIVVIDAEAVAVDLGGVPLDELLDYRRDQLPALRAYRRSLRRCVREVSVLPDAERYQALADRREEIRDWASAARRSAERAWRRPVSLALGATGAMWTWSTGDPVGALLAGTGVAVGATGPDEAEPGLFSYMIDLPGTSAAEPRRSGWRRGVELKFEQAFEAG